MSAPPARTALAWTLAALQAAQALSWTVYATYLPALVADAGLAPGVAAALLLADQLVFTLMDPLMGALADRLGRAYARVAPAFVVAAVVAGVTFALAPLAGSPGALVAAIAVWALASTLLRAPPLKLLARHAAAPSRPALAAVALTGLGLAGALAPALAAALRGVSPWLPFALASASLVATTAALVVAERRAPSPAPEAPAGRTRVAELAALLVGTLLAAWGAQVLTAVRAKTLYLRFAREDALGALLPLFWVGFGVALFPASKAVARWGAPAAVAAGAALGAAGAALSELAPGLGVLAPAQLAAGAGWAGVAAGGVAAATTLAPEGRAGTAVGLWSGAVALATFARIALVTAGTPAPGAALGLASAGVWALGAAVVALGAARTPRAR